MVYTKSKTTITNMDNVIVIESDESEDSENSVIEVEIPKKPTPPLIYIEDEEMVLNIKEKRRDCLLAKDFIQHDKSLSSTTEMENSVENPNSPTHWTVDMIKYYNDDWGDEEEFIVEELQKKMDKHPSLWIVSNKDRLKIHRDFGRNKLNCWNCGQRGHFLSECPDPPFVPKCHMCGIEGHVEYLCPNSKCLTCGNHTRSYVTCCHKCRRQLHETCSRCRLTGHNFINCPDHWRLFHMTTGTTTIKVPTGNILKTDTDLWCCNCGRRGHYQVWCDQRKDNDGFTDSLPFVVSYERDFNSNRPNNNSNDTPIPMPMPVHMHMPRKKSKKSRRRERKAKEKERILKLNQQNKAIRKNNIELIKIEKKNTKNKKNKIKKNIQQRYFDGMLIQ